MLTKPTTTSNKKANTTATCWKINHNQQQDCYYYSNMLTKSTTTSNKTAITTATCWQNQPQPATRRLSPEQHVYRIKHRTITEAQIQLDLTDLPWSLSPHDVTGKVYYTERLFLWVRKDTVLIPFQKTTLPPCLGDSPQIHPLQPRQDTLINTRRICH